MSKYDTKIIERAKELYLKGLSLEKIQQALINEFKINGLHRSNVDYWVRKYKWNEEKKEIVKNGIQKGKKKSEKNIKKKNLSSELEDYHAENYDMDSNLRIESYFKLKKFLENTDIDVFNARLFADVFRISTGNIVKLWEIAKTKNDDVPLLDELLKMRGKKNDN